MKQAQVKSLRLFWIFPSLDSSLFSYFMDGSRKTYKVGDLVMPDKKVFPLIAAQLRAGCVSRQDNKEVHVAKIKAHELIKERNLLLLSNAYNSTDYSVLRNKFAKRNQEKNHFPIELETYDCSKVKEITTTKRGNRQKQIILCTNWKLRLLLI